MVLFTPGQPTPSLSRVRSNRSLGSTCPSMPYLGLKEALGPLDALSGDVDLGEAGQHVQPAVLLQLPSRGLAENQEELRQGGREAQGVRAGGEEAGSLATARPRLASLGKRRCAHGAGSQRAGSSPSTLCACAGPVPLPPWASVCPSVQWEARGPVSCPPRIRGYGKPALSILSPHQDTRRHGLNLPLIFVYTVPQTNSLSIPLTESSKVHDDGPPLQNVRDRKRRAPTLSSRNRGRKLNPCPDPVLRPPFLPAACPPAGLAPFSRPPCSLRGLARALPVPRGTPAPTPRLGPPRPAVQPHCSLAGRGPAFLPPQNRHACGPRVRVGTE